MKIITNVPFEIGSLSQMVLTVFFYKIVKFQSPLPTNIVESFKK
jgi:hypothetical protein